MLDRSFRSLDIIRIPEEDVFQRVLDKFFNGKKDTRTIAILRQIGEI